MRNLISIDFSCLCQTVRKNSLDVRLRIQFNLIKFQRIFPSLRLYSNSRTHVYAINKTDSTLCDVWTSTQSVLKCMYGFKPWEKSVSNYMGRRRESSIFASCLQGNRENTNLVLGNFLRIGFQLELTSLECRRVVTLLHRTPRIIKHFSFSKMFFYDFLMKLIFKFLKSAEIL